MKEQSEQPSRTGEAAHTPTLYRIQESAYSHGSHGELHILSLAENVTFAVVYFDRANPNDRQNAENRAAFIVESCNSHARLTAENKALRDSLTEYKEAIATGEEITLGMAMRSTAALQWANAQVQRRPASEPSTQTDDHGRSL